MGKFIDLTGQKFGRLTVIERAENNKNGSSQWVCRCECGNNKVVFIGNLKNGHTTSCGCLQREQAVKANTKHGMKHTRIYNEWCGINRRCYNQNDRCYNNYGGRGITICDEWKNDFQAFYNWAMANGYADDLTIDRIDVNGNYEPSNCRWITRKEQGNNTRRNHLLTYNGKTQTLAQWADEIGISYDTLCSRIVQRHWDIERALTTPVRK